MKQFFVIVSLLLAMLGLKSLGIESTSGFDPLFLAALGFVVLAAFSSAEIVGKLNLPKVTGFILVGVIFGPQVSDVLSSRIVTDTKIFTTLALGLIALSAGLELQLEGLKKVSKTLSLTVFFKLITLFSIVLGGFVVALGFFEVSASFSAGEKLAIGLIFSALSIGTSPAIVLAIINESKAKGRMVDITLGIAIIKDVIVVLTLAVCLAVSKTLTIPGSGFSPDILLHLAEEIGLSILVGIALGVLLILYLRYIKKEMLIFVTLVVLAVAEVSAVLHLELLLVFIVAGFVVSNFSKFEHDLMKPLEKVSLPIFIIFFTNAGAALDLISIQKILPIAVILCVLRAISFYISGYAGAKLGNEGRKIAKYSWLCYLPQAGVTLGLVGIASEQMPAYSEFILNVGMGMVGINLILGPIALRLGFTATSEEAGASMDTDDNGGEKLLGVDMGLDKEVDLPDSLRQLEINYIEGRKEYLHKHLSGELLKSAYSLLDNFCERSIRNTETYNQKIVRFEHVTDALVEKIEFFDQLRHDNIDSLTRLPQVFETPFRQSWYDSVKTDSLLIRVQKRLSKVASYFKKNKMQKILVRACFRKQLYGYYLRSERMFAGEWLRTLLKVSNEFSLKIEEKINDEELKSRFRQVLNEFETRVESEFSSELLKEKSLVDRDLYLSGTFYLPERRLKFSNFESEFKDSKLRISSDLKEWKKIFLGHRGYLKLRYKLKMVESIFTDMMERKVLSPLRRFENNLSKITTEILVDLGEIKGAIQLDLDESGRLSVMRKIELQRTRLDNVRVQSERIVDSGFEKNVLVAINNLGGLDESYRILSTDSLMSARPGKAKFSNVRISDSLMIEIEGKLLSEINNYSVELHQSILRLVQQLVDRVEKINLRSNNLENFSDIELKEYKKDIDVEIDSFVTLLSSTEVLCDREIDEFASVVEKSTIEVFKNIENLETRDIYLAKTTSKFQRLVKSWAKSLKLLLSDGYYSIKNRVSGLITSGQRLKISNEYKQMKVGIQKGELDSTTVCNYLDSIYKTPYIESLPQSYLRLFSADALYDDRLALDTRRMGLLGGCGDGKKILIVGESGIGKTTQINILSTKLQKPVLDIRNFSFTERSLMASLALTLNVEPGIRSVLNEIKKRDITIVVDDLNSWWSPLKIKELDHFFEIISKPGIRVNWIVSMSEKGFGRLKNSFDFSSVFTEIVHLSRVTRAEVECYIDKRHKYSGRDIVYPSTIKINAIQNVIKQGNQKLFHQYLFELSRGNFRVLSFLWLKSISNFEQNSLTVSFSRSEVANFEFLDSLSDSRKFLIDELLAFKYRSITDLRDSLGFDVKTIRKDISFLEKCGILIKNNRGVHCIRPEIEPSIENYLQ